MKMTRWGRVFLLCVRAGCSGPALAWGQTTGQIRGIAKDSSGAVVPGANITAILMGTATTRQRFYGRRWGVSTSPNCRWARTR